MACAGRVAVVVNSNWNGQVKVELEGAVKSYQLKHLRPAPAPGQGTGTGVVAVQVECMRWNANTACFAVKPLFYSTPIIQYRKSVQF